MGLSNQLAHKLACWRDLNLMKIAKMNNLSPKKKMKLKTAMRHFIST